MKDDPLSFGAIKVTHRLVDASNATLLGEIDTFGKVIYKPIAGERPLWDFPHGTLADREVAAYKLSEFLELHLVPRTILREGPYGWGMVQEWISISPEFNAVQFGQSDDPQLRKLALFDAIVNNTDRKFGHLLLNQEGRLFGCDHGVTFHHEDKLRTVLWQFAGDPLGEDELKRLEEVKSGAKRLASMLIPHLTQEEVDAVIVRVDRLIFDGIFPYPSDNWPAVPWPPV